MDWERLEAELAGPSLADRIVTTARRQRARRTAAVAAVAMTLIAALVALGLAVVLHGRPTSAPLLLARPVRTVQPDAATDASVYAAALRASLRAGRSSQRIWVDSRICFSVPATPSPAKCADRLIPVRVRRMVVAVLGSGLRFAAHPPAPRGLGDPPVVQFGRLVVRTNKAQLGVETRCGPGCAEGETVVLRRRGRRWHVVGSIGPRWVS